MERRKVLKNELSKNNKYYISKHRYYELKHMVMQIPEWRKKYAELNAKYINSHSLYGINPSPSNKIVDYVADLAMEKRYYADKINIIHEAASKADPYLGAYILEGVICNISFYTLLARYGEKKIACSRDTYYVYYRKFFWELDKLLNPYA